MTGDLKVKAKVTTSSRSVRESLDEITSRVQNDLVERGDGVKTRKAAVELMRPQTKCCIL